MQVKLNEVSIFAKKQVFAEHYNGEINYPLINRF